MPRAIALALALLASACAAPQPARAGESERLAEAVLLSADQVGAGWQVVEESPTEVDGDPDLVSWGVQAQRSRHYTRRHQGAAQVCSLEVWAFATLNQARTARASFRYPDWEITREGRLLLMLRALTRPSNAPPRRALFPDCRRLGERARARAAELSAE